MAGLLNQPTESANDPAFREFMTEVAKAVCQYRGGEVRHEASLFDQEAGWLIGIHANSALPVDGGVWKEVDPEGTFSDVEPVPFPDSTVYVMNGKDKHEGVLKNLGTICRAFAKSSEALEYAKKHFSDTATGSLQLTVQPVQYQVDPSNDHWNQYDEALANYQGWSMVQSEPGVNIERFDEGSNLENDQHAAAFVKERALAGSALHIKAIRFLVQHESPSVCRYGVMPVYLDLLAASDRQCH